MSSASVVLTTRERSDVGRVLAAGVTAAGFDLVYAWLLYSVALGKVTAIQVPQSVAAGLLGREAAFAGGVPSALLGLVLHFSIGCIWATIFYSLLRYAAPVRQAMARKRGVLWVGLAYGVFVWLSMNLIVLPLSRATGAHPYARLFVWHNGLSIIHHAFFVGLPIALIESGLWDGRIVEGRVG